MVKYPFSQGFCQTVLLFLQVLSTTWLLWLSLPLNHQLAACLSKTLLGMEQLLLPNYSLAPASVHAALFYFFLDRVFLCRKGWKEPLCSPEWPQTPPASVHTC